MSKLNVDIIRDYVTYNRIVTINNDTDIIVGKSDGRLYVENSCSLVPENSDSGDLTRPATYIVNSGITTIGQNIGVLPSPNVVYLVPTDIERRINLPPPPELGDWITITDIGSGASNSGNASKRNISIYPNGTNTIQGGSAGDPLIIDIDARSVTLMWCGSPSNWRLVGS